MYGRRAGKGRDTPSRRLSVDVSVIMLVGFTCGRASLPGRLSEQGHSWLCVRGSMHGGFHLQVSRIDRNGVLCRLPFRVTAARSHDFRCQIMMPLQVDRFCGAVQPLNEAEPCVLIPESVEFRLVDSSFR
jgi:hypothetical protein